MKKHISYFVVLLLAVVIATPEDIFARGRSGGGFSRSSSSRSWGSSSRSSRSSSWGSSRSSRSKAPSKAKIASNRKAMAAKRSAHTTKQLKPADKKLYSAAKKNGTSYKSKAAAQKAFKEKNAKKYTSTYATKPATRPSHIPSTYRGAGGRSYNVTYNSVHGGYGYMGPSGSWIMYNAMADAVMMDTMMRRQNYYYTPSYVTPYREPVVVHHTGGSFFMTLVWVSLGIFLFVVIIGFFCNYSSSRY